MESDFVSIPEIMARIKWLQVENEALKKVITELMHITQATQIQVIVDVEPV